MVSTTAALQPAVSNNASSMFAAVSAANLVSFNSMDGALVLQAQQLSVQLAAAGILPHGLPSAAAVTAADVGQCAVQLPNYMQQQQL
jgi:hypothetical protein